MVSDERLLLLKNHLDKACGKIEDGIFVDALAVGDATLISKDGVTVLDEIIVVYLYGDRGNDYNEVKTEFKETWFERYVQKNFKNAIFVNVYTSYDVEDIEVNFKAIRSDSKRAYRLKYKNICNDDRTLIYDCEVIINKLSQSVVSVDMINELMEVF